MKPVSIERLVILGSTVTALALVRNADGLGLECFVVSTEHGIATRTRKARIRILEPNADDDLLEVLRKLAQERPSALIIDSDSGLRFLCKYRGDLEKDFNRILHPDNGALRVCLDKERFLSWCDERQIPAPRLVSEVEIDRIEERDFPLMVRPAETQHGASSSLPKAVQVFDREAFDALCMRYAKENAAACISTSLVGSNVRQFSVGVARNAGGESRTFVAEKLRPSSRFCGGGTYVVAVPDDAPSELANRVLSELDYFGIAEVEILADESTGKLNVVEVNARPWVQYSLAYRSGFDFLAFLIAPDRYSLARERPAGGRWLYWRDDLYVVFSRSEGMLWRGELTLWEYLHSVLRANSYPVWSIGDPIPVLSKVLP